MLCIAKIYQDSSQGKLTCDGHMMCVHCYFDRHNDVDIVIIRENTEGEYSGLEHEVKVEVFKV